jgi:lactoylglutathione lyase
MELNHTCLMVSDLERSLAFYSLLGFEPRRSLSSGPGSSVFCGLPDDGDRLQLRLTDEIEPAMSRFGHIAVDVEDLDALLGRLAAYGVAPDQPPVVRGSLRICFVHDPDGYAVELLEQERRGFPGKIRENPARTTEGLR